MDNHKNELIDDYSEFENHVFEFIENIILGIELKVWEKFNEKNDGNNKSEIDQKLKSSEAIYISNSMMEYYLNQTYKNLVDKTDDCVNEFLIAFQEKINLSNFTCLNIISNVIMNSYTKLPRSKLNLENKEKYKDSVLDTCKLMKKFIMFDFRMKLKDVQNKIQSSKLEDLE